MVKYRDRFVVDILYLKTVLESHAVVEMQHARSANSVGEIQKNVGLVALSFALVIHLVRLVDEIHVFDEPIAEVGMVCPLRNPRPLIDLVPFVEGRVIIGY